MTLRCGSLFAGVGGFDLGLEFAGWQTVWQVEIDDQARQVLRRHWPDATRYEDVKDVGESNLAPVDLICGGFPCQDLSVAGRREGLGGERSGLFFEFMRVVDEVAPRWVLIENVPGLLSSNEGRDMGTVLGTLADLGYGWTYRVLDTQYFGPPQRRRRVFIVGHSGGPCPPEILLEPESVPWNPPPSREAGEGTTPLLEVGARTSGDGYRDGDGIGQSGDPLYTLQARHQHGIVQAANSDPARGKADDGDLANPEGDGGRGVRRDARGDSVEPESFQGRPYARSFALRGRDGGATAELGDGKAYALRGSQGGGDKPYVIAGQCHGTNVLPFDTTQITSKGNYSRPKPGDPCHPLARGAHAPAITPTLQASDAGTSRPGGPRLGSEEDYHPVAPVPRRLTPVETERLQGFPDDWTAWGIDEGGERVEMADTPRYRFLGNAVSVPVAAWIGRRILEVHEKTERAA